MEMANDGNCSTEPRVENVSDVSTISSSSSSKNPAETCNQESSDEEIHRRRRRSLAGDFEASEESEDDEYYGASEISLEAIADEMKSMSIATVESKPTDEIKLHDKDIAAAKEIKKIEEIPAASDVHVQKEIFFTTGPTGQTRIKHFRNPIDSQMWPRDRLTSPHRPMQFPDRRTNNNHKNRQNDYFQFYKNRSRTFNNHNRGPVQVDSYPSLPSEFTNRSLKNSASLGDSGNDNKNIELICDLSKSKFISKETKNVGRRESVQVQNTSNYVDAKNETQPGSAAMPSRSYYFIDHALMDQISPKTKSNNYMVSSDSGNKTGELHKPRNFKRTNGQFSPKITVTTESSFNDKPHEFKTSSSKRYTNMRRNVRSPTDVVNSTQSSKSQVESTIYSRKTPKIEVSVSSTNSSAISPKPTRKNTSLDPDTTADLEKIDNFTREVKDISLSENPRSQSITPTSRVSPISPTIRGNSSSDSRGSLNVKRQIVVPQPPHPPPPALIAPRPVTTVIPQVYPQCHSYDQSYLMQGIYYQPSSMYNQAYFDPNMAMYHAPPAFQYSYFPQQFVDYQHQPAFYYPHHGLVNDIPSTTGNSFVGYQAPPYSADSHFGSFYNSTSHSSRSPNYHTNNRYHHPGSNSPTPPYSGDVQSGDRIIARHENTAGT